MEPLAAATALDHEAQRVVDALAYTVASAVLRRPQLDDDLVGAHRTLTLTQQMPCIVAVALDHQATSCLAPIQAHLPMTIMRFGPTRLLKAEEATTQESQHHLRKAQMLADFVAALEPGQTHRICVFTLDTQLDWSELLAAPVGMAAIASKSNVTIDIFTTGRAAKASVSKRIHPKFFINLHIGACNFDSFLSVMITALDGSKIDVQGHGYLFVKDPSMHGYMLVPKDGEPEAGRIFGASYECYISTSFHLLLKCASSRELVCTRTDRRFVIVKENSKFFLRHVLDRKLSKESQMGSLATYLDVKPSSNVCRHIPPKFGTNEWKAAKKHDPDREDFEGRRLGMGSKRVNI